jgi:hypothetical protein
MRPCVVTCGRASWHVAVHRDIWPTSWHVTVHCDMWPYIVTCDRASWHVTVHRDMWPYIVTYDRTSWQILIIKPTRCTNFSYFILELKLYMFRTVPLPIIRRYSLYTQQWYMSYRFVDSLRAVSGWNGSSILILLSARKLSVWHVPLLCVQWITPDDGQRNCPKNVEFHFQNKFEKISASSWFYCKKTWWRSFGRNMLPRQK